MSRLDRLAKLCRDTYIRLREAHERKLNPQFKSYLPGPRWDGGRINRTTYTSEWRRLAEFFDEHQLDVEGCMWMRFDQWGHRPSAPMPNAMRSMSWLNAYKELSLSMGRQAAASLATDKATLSREICGTWTEMGMDAREAALFALMDSRNSMSPLFRYCVARQEGMAGAAARYEQEAWDQYRLFSKQYDEAWGGLIPVDLRARPRSEGT